MASIPFGCHAAPFTNGISLFADGRTSCPPGFFCPNSTATDVATSPRICPANAECVLSRLTGKQCTPQGPLEPILCPIRFYCPDSKTMLPCPDGSYCPFGTANPITCPAGSVCPADSSAPSSYSGTVACLVIDFVIILLFLVRFVSERRSNSSGKLVPEGRSSCMPSPVNSADIAAKPSSLVIALDSSKRASFHIPSNRISVLTEAFERMLGGRNVLMDFQFANMCFTLPSQKVILRNVTGSIYARKMTAIMGPSGAGKTTFMNVLCGKVDRTSGTLRISGKVAEVHHFKKLIGYVPQEDIMLRELTVRQNMMHSARVRLPSSWSAEEVGKYVDDLLVALKLDHVKHSRIGDETLRGVSGGQRKRVNIGIELAAAPVCLFLDEPTSGLDSTAALDVCRILKEISVLGFTIVAVLHQPRIEIFNKFDEVLLLAEGGSTAYIGPVTDAQPYFEAMGFVFSKGINPADVLMDILSGKGITKNDAEISAADLVDKWQVYESSKHPVGGLAVSPSTSPSSVDFHTFAPALMKERGASWIMQFIYCHNRSVLQQIATPASFALEIFVGAVAGSVMGFAISSETKYSGLFILPLTALSPATVEWLMPQVGFISQLSCGLAAGPAAVKVFSEERTVFWREASAGHKSLPYFLGKVVASTYRILLSSLHFATCFHILANPIFSLGVTYAIILVSYLGVYGLATTVSMIVRRENGALLSVVVCLFYSVFSGYAINLRQARNWGIAWLFDQSFTRWAAEAMYSESITPYSHVYMTEISAAEWGYTLNRVPFDLGMAVVSGLVWRVIAYILMIALHRDKQR